MENYSVFFVKYIEGIVAEGLTSEEEYLNLHNSFQNETYSKKDVIQLAKRYNYSNLDRFEKVVNNLNNSYISLNSKFPVFRNENYQDRFKMIYKDYVHRLLYGEPNSIESRNDEPNNIVFTINFPPCRMDHFPVDFDPEGTQTQGEFCPGWFENRCQQDFNLCATLAQRDFIDEIINTCSLFGKITEPVVWTDWNVFDGVPSNQNGFGGYDLVISFLEPSQPHCSLFMSEILVARTLEDICDECISKIANECCD